ncbi:hypothetical protein DUI87_23208 [Hirundo rustica rustica]|uniref:Uncharacterized protein n=1 Tax=Hirundo rustica rustica TaxID=333673 RepID=A0A3M0JJV3_HIRRU|nr:hypothetical protein DUI87_23208 [Hirundo rustica rustica]
MGFEAEWFDFSSSQQVEEMELLKYVVSEVILPLLMGSALAGGGYILEQTSLIKRSVLALEMNTFKDETTLNMSANFKTSMKKLKVMKKWIAEPEADRDQEKLPYQASTESSIYRGQPQKRQMYS